MMSLIVSLMFIQLPYQTTEPVNVLPFITLFMANTEIKLQKSTSLSKSIRVATTCGVLLVDCLLLDQKTAQAQESGNQSTADWHV